MATSSTLDAGAPDVEPPRWRPSPTVVAIGGFVLVSALLLILGRLAVDHQVPGFGRQEFEPGIGWWGQWVRWDGNWYFHVARDGYAFHVGPQESVAFWPIYPLVMRFLSVLTNDQYDSGLIITWLSGLGTIVLLSIWCRDKMSRAAAIATVICLLVYPYAWYLHWSVYADALFAVCAIGAFVLVERDRPVLAGLVGALAAAARPMGLAVVIGMVVLVLERRDCLVPITAGPDDGAVKRAAAWLRVPRRIHPSRVERRDWGVLLALVGPLAYVTFLWINKGNPLAFSDAESAAGWEHTAEPRTWLKIAILDNVRAIGFTQENLGMLFHGCLAIGSILLVPKVVRRFGWGYGLYVLVLVGIPAVSSKDFYGLGRYLLGAFPVLAVVGEWLAERRLVTRTAVWSVSAVALGYLAYSYARGQYLA